MEGNKPLIKRVILSLLRVFLRFKILNRPLQKLARAGILPAGIWKRLPVETTFCIKTPDGRKFNYVLTYGDFIGNKFFWLGDQGFEYETLSVFYKLAKKANYVVDVGSNTGIYMLYAATANANGKVLVFEPVEQIYAILCANIEANGYGNRCTALKQAVSDYTGVTSFHVPKVLMPSSASLNTDGFRDSEGDIVEIPVTTVDDMVKEDERINLIKIDVEGFEDKVLAGMTKVLASSHPRIVIECLEDGPIAEIERILKENDYNFYIIKESGLEPMTSIIPDPQEKYRNFLCVHSEDTAVTAEL